MRFGAVLFDMPDSGGEGTGWASIEGGDPFRVDSVQALAQDMRWWSNLSYDSVRLQRNFRTSTVKIEGYLRTKMDHLIQELGLAGKRPVDVVPYLSRLFANVMQGAHQFYGVDIERVGGDDFLSKDLAAAFRLNVRNDKPLEPIENSFQNMNWCSGRWQSDVIYTWIRRPRIQHALEILSMPVPKFGGKWEALNSPELLNKPNIVDFLIRFPQPVLAKVSVENISPEVSDLIGFGNTGNKYEKKVRRWLSQPELLWMSGYADIRVEDVYTCEAYQPGFMSDSSPIKDFLPVPLLDRGFNEFSITAGLLAENYWVALANKISKTRNGKTESYVPASASWMRSIDRMLMFMTAVELRNVIDIEVNSYSVGTLNVSFPISMWSEVFHSVYALDLFMPPFPPKLDK